MSSTAIEPFTAEREDLALACRRIGALGFVTSHGGNLSYRVADDRVLITPTKVAKRLVAAEDLVMIDMDGSVVWSGNDHKPTGEVPMHLRIYSQRPDLKSIVHAHPPILTGFAISDRGDLLAKPLLPEPITEVGPVVVVDYAEPVSPALAAEFDKVIHKSNAFLMKNHGVTVCSAFGTDRTLDLLHMLEMQAYSVWVAKTIGNVDSIPIAEVDVMERTRTGRGLPIPADPRRVTRLVDQYE